MRDRVLHELEAATEVAEDPDRHGQVVRRPGDLGRAGLGRDLDGALQVH